MHPPRRALQETKIADVFYLRQISFMAMAASEYMHDVDGLECRAVSVAIAAIGDITVLEATAKAQESLVEDAIRLEEHVVDPDIRVNAGDIYGNVLWPSASAVANYVLSKISFRQLSKKTVLELGSGSGLVSIALSRGGAMKVIASDYETVPLRLFEYAQSNLNPIPSHPCSIETTILDICDKNIPLPEADLVVAADVMYESSTGNSMAHRTMEALKRGSRVVIGCSPGRPGRPAFLEELKRLEPRIKADFVSAIGTTLSLGQPKSEIPGPGQQKNASVLILDLDPKSCLSPT